MIPKRMKSGSMIKFSIVLWVVIHGVAGDHVERAASIRCGRSIAARLLSFGGNHTIPHSWPWMVALRKKLPENKNEFFCAGSLIAERHVVSGKDR
jgi:hypothetical protein